MPFDLTEYSDAMNSALAEGAPCVLATVDREGNPDIGFKGSMMVFDKERLAYWERTRGRHLSNLLQSPKVAVMYFNRERKLHLRFFGRATLYEEGPMREQVMARVVAPELERDPEREGAAVLIDVDTVMDPFGKGILYRGG